MIIISNLHELPEDYPPKPKPLFEKNWNSEINIRDE